MILRARSRPVGDTTADAHEWTVAADDYDDAVTEARQAVPDGWVLLSVQTIG